MTPLVAATVVFGDVVGSRDDPGTPEFLRALRDDLEAAYGKGRLAPSGFTQGDELQLLLAPGYDPFQAVLRAALRPDARGIRWAIVAGDVLAGTGPATERTGPAFLAARELLERTKTRRLGLLARSGDPSADALLDELGPVLAALLDELTDRQREIARLILIDDLRRAEAAERLGVSRATVSVIAARARVRHLGALASALARTFRDGVERASAAADNQAIPAGAA
jgi:RNA polymerase sigma factor (sigma-70 family)